MDNATSFGAQATHYAAARPGYPDDLFGWIKDNTPDQNLVWDVGTGSGQAAKSLAEHFSKVHATDIDGDQIAQAARHPIIHYLEAPAHNSGLPDNSADAITVATALHWFDFDKFWTEVARVARPGALFCGWTYHRAVVDAEVREFLFDPIFKMIEPYWSDGNRLSWRGYTKAELAMPFDEIKTPEFTCELNWTPQQVAAFARSWSAHKKARLDGFETALADIETQALSQLGDASRPLTLPLNILAGRVS